MPDELVTLPATTPTWSRRLCFIPQRIGTQPAM